jgi:hypothetical protein
MTYVAATAGVTLVFILLSAYRPAQLLPSGIAVLEELFPLVVHTHYDLIRSFKRAALLDNKAVSVCRAAEEGSVIEPCINKRPLNQ